MNPLRNPCLTLLATLMLAPAAWADEGMRDGRPHQIPEDMRDWAPEFVPLAGQEFPVIALHRATQIVSARFQGRLIAARLTAPDPQERERGVVLVQELRLLTPDRDVLRIRLDARTGDFLEVAGRGLTRARRIRTSQ